ncbi:MAG: polysaccharide ABC transporter ATP-binding protein [Bacteroidota bacterium]|nr:polysaccharide ABC transporter ATP-binding protein [Bacteroidota bacterium]
MSNTVIKVEDVGKLYKLGEIGTGTISHDLNRWWARMRGKEDPFSKIGSVNDRTVKSDNDWVWALKDINLEVKQGEVLGIIGRNGAGKSTLLKILSKVTTPSTGSIKIKGRIASLLEVGTGFHQELTGRENIFLNGAILGMSKAEIRSKFDEIVDFSGVERYIDTPVKRYSSGMYVRLAFAVAAFLEPEILIIDEVLAVGDAEFQRKCLGKMGEVSKSEGRTVLFVSHNFIAVRSLCTKSVLLDKGIVKAIGHTEDVLHQYLSAQLNSSKVDLNEKCNGKNENQFIAVRTIELLGNLETPGSFALGKNFKIIVSAVNKSVQSKINVNLFFYNPDNILVFATCSAPQNIPLGNFQAVCDFPAEFFNDITYTISVMVVTGNTPLITVEEAISIEGVEVNRDAEWLGKFPGLIRPNFKWNLDY